MPTAASPTPLAPNGGSVRMPLRTLRSSAANIAAAANNPRMNLRRGSSLARTASAAPLPPPPPPPSGIENQPPPRDEDDSSDDENMAPVLSAAAEELLGGRTSQTGPRQSLASAVPTLPVTAQRQNNVRNYAEFVAGSPLGRDSAASRGAEGSAVRRSISPQQPLHQQQQQAPSALRSKSPRIVRIGSINRNGSPGSAMLRRAKSAGSANGSPAQRELRDYKTPAPAPRPKSHLGNEDGSPVRSGQQASVEPRSAYHGSGESVAHSSAGDAEARDGLQQGTVTREHGVPNSLRIKRLGQGTFLRGPARRGIIRRQTEEEQSPLQRNGADYGNLYGEMNPQMDDNESPTDEHAPSKVRFTAAQMPPPVDSIQEALPAPVSSRSPVHRPVESQAQPGSAVHRKVQSVSKPTVADILPSQHDKENEAPAPHRRAPSAAEILADLPLKPVVPASIQAFGQISPRRAPLAAKSANTPLRPAPPPPKMNVVDTATAAAGAMASQKRKKQTTASMTVNGRRYTRLDCIGRGGSGKVFRVMAENYKLYALKRVSLEGMDEMAIRGFKGEINLLQKLKEVERVVRLIDYEVNDERQTLTVLMEMGELDLKKLLDPRLDEQTGAFDVTFTRYIWKEMLECVQAVHEFDVVHSDLKPANFVMVSGKLKLIDFGIANAIADDTVNVHREQQIGTPNYMAPEALVDTNAHERGLPGVAKLMKLGKPSDVWSLGCILYQIVYGKPPFGHIQATHTKVMAIVSDRHQITFPDTGLGGAHVPLGLLRTLKRCLIRDQKLRPSIAELLDERDPFLHPDADGLIPLSANLLGLIQKKLVSTIRQRDSLPDDGELALWGPNMFENVRNAMKEGKL